MEISIESAKKILKKTKMDVTEEASREFAKLLEEITADFASEAAAIANREKKKSVSKSEIRKVKKELNSIKLG